MSSFQLIKQGIPTVGFIVLGAYSLSVFVEGKNKAVDLSRGKSRSEREAEVEREYEKILSKLPSDFDNTKRVPRPDDLYRVEKEKFLKKQWEERESERRKKSWWRW